MKKIFCVLGAALAAISGFALAACGSQAEGGDALTVQNLASLKGKTVGVAQLNNVPGLTLQATGCRRQRRPTKSTSSRSTWRI